MAPVIDIPAFIDSLIFNVLIGNADAHAKNYSLLYTGSERRLSPFYDLVSTLAWPELSTKSAMKIGGCKSIHTFTIGEWKKWAGKAHLGWPMIRERMAEASHAIQNELDGVRTQIREYNGEMADRLHALIGERAARMLSEV